MSSSPTDWPVVGRDPEINRLKAMMANRESAGVIIAGPSGVGKTRLAYECLAMAEQLDLETAWVPATQPLSKVPFGSIALFPGFELGGDGIPNLHRVDLVRQAASALVDSASGKRMVLFVDDAQFLDPMSAAVIHQLAVTKAAFVLATERSGESSPAPILALWKDRVLERTELRGLDNDSLSELLRRVLGGQVDPAAVSELARQSQGNMLYLRELVLGALQDGALTQEMGVWRLAGLVYPPDRLVGLVEARLIGLATEERELLELLSIMEPLGSAELKALSDEQVAEGLEAKGLIVSSLEGAGVKCRFAHPLYGDVLRAKMPQLRRQRLARSLAELVESSEVGCEDILRVATLRLISGGGEPGLMLSAAREARWHYDFALAERLANASVALGAGFEARLLAAQVAGLQGRVPDADKALLELAHDATNDDQRGRVAITRLDNAIWGPDPFTGTAIVEAAEAQITDPVWRTEIAGRRATLLGLSSGPNAQVAAAQELVATTSGRVLAKACMTLAVGLARQGCAEASIAASARGMAEQLALSEPLDFYPWVHAMNRCEALEGAGRVLEYEQIARQEYAEALTQGSVEQQAFFAWYIAKAALARGRVRTAARHAREAVALFHEIGRPLWTRCSLGSLACATALAGFPVEAVAAAAQIDELQSTLTMYMAPDIIRARAWVAVAEGRESFAREQLEQAADLGERIGDRVGAAYALHDLVRLGHPKGAASRLEDLATAIDGDLVATMAAHARALCGKDAEALEMVSPQFESIGADLLAADAAAHAAISWSDAGDRRKSAAAERRVAVLVGRCEEAKTPATMAIGDAALLSPAERDTAVLAAAGRSNKAIASELFVSVRTVETRLNHVYLKLGISGRQELASVFRPGSF